MAAEPRESALSQASTVLLGSDSDDEFARYKVPVDFRSAVHFHTESSIIGLSSSSSASARRHGQRHGGGGGRGSGSGGSGRMSGSTSGSGAVEEDNNHEENEDDPMDVGSKSEAGPVVSGTSGSRSRRRVALLSSSSGGSDSGTSVERTRQRKEDRSHSGSSKSGATTEEMTTDDEHSNDDEAPSASSRDKASSSFSSRSSVPAAAGSSASKTSGTLEKKDKAKTKKKRKAALVNLRFYRCQSVCLPDKATIDEIHSQWYYDLDFLEHAHGYIQWLFPLFEGGGMNWHSSALTGAEARAMVSDLAVAIRLVKSYRLMLHFYGVELVDLATGELARGPEAHCTARYRNLAWHSHNNLRITRILKCLGHTGFARYKEPFVTFMAAEVTGPSAPLAACKSSYERFWKTTLHATTKAFIKTTGETEEDRIESVFFEALRNGTVGWDDVAPPPPPSSA